VENSGKYKDKKYHANINPIADPESKIELWWGIFERESDLLKEFFRASDG